MSPFADEELVSSLAREDTPGIVGWDGSVTAPLTVEEIEMVRNRTRIERDSIYAPLKQRIAALKPPVDGKFDGFKTPKPMSKDDALKARKIIDMCAKKIGWQTPYGAKKGSNGKPQYTTAVLAEANGLYSTAIVRVA